MDIHIWISIYGYPYMDIHIWISIYGYPYMDIHTWISIYGPSPAMIEHFLRPTELPMRAQDASKTPPRPSKMAPDAYRTAPRRLQERRRRPQEASIRLQVDFLTIFLPVSASHTTKIKPPLQRELHFSSPRCMESYVFDTADFHNDYRF